eukprot:403343222
MGDQYAWLDSKKQFYTSGIKPANSQIFQRNTQGNCFDPLDFRQNLLPGRNCSYDTQCLSGVCNTAGVCAGKPINEPCSETSECEINLACIQSTRTFPWQTICKKLLYEEDSCEDDYQCGYNMICSFKTAADSFNDIKVCMKKYDLLDGSITGYRMYESDTQSDSLKNGLKCRSGICRAKSATECVCASIVNITSDYGPQTDSTFYKCSAMSQYNSCQYFYVHDDDADGKNNLGHLSLPCQCSLDGSVGYCPLPSQTQIQSYLAVLKTIDTYTSNCHTMDRYNFAAQMECGIGKQYVNVQDLYSLIDAKFKFEWFAFSQYQSNRAITIHPCLNKGHPESPINVIKQTQLLRKIYSKTTY